MRIRQATLTWQCFAFALLLLAISNLNLHPAFAQTGHSAKTRIARSDFLFGVNLPWFDGAYGHDLGREAQHPNYGVWYDVKGNSDKVSSYFNDIDAIGFRVVRVWLMERSEGWEVDKDGIITKLNDAFLRNVDDVVARAKANHVKLYLCLTTGCGEIDFPSHLKDPKQQKAYLENCVKPLAKRFKGNDTIFAFDIINEIESELRDSVGPDKIDIDQAKAFIRNNVKAIKSEDPKRLVSSGSNWDMVQHFKGLGLDFYDIHVYRDDSHLPNVQDFMVDRPIIVGEFGVGTKKDNDDALQQKVVVAFMKNALERGYAGCFVWAYGPRERYFNLVQEGGKRRPVVDDIERIIRANSKPTEAQVASDAIRKKLRGTKWTNSNNASFEWTDDGRFLHCGNEVQWKVLDAQRGQIVFGPGKTHTLIFNKAFTEFEQQFDDGSKTFKGKRSDKSKK